MYQRKVDVDMLNTVKSVLADVSSVSLSSEQSLIYSFLLLQRFCLHKQSVCMFVFTLRAGI